MEIFEEMFPYYLSIGMTATQYWDEDCLLVKAYRKAEDLRRERRNQEMWLQGAYVYDAILRVSPILHAFAKKGTKAQPYVSEPYSVSDKQDEVKRETAEKKKYDLNKAKMEAFMTQFNTRFEGGKHE